MKQFSSYEELYSYFKICNYCNNENFVGVASATPNYGFLYCNKNNIIFYNSTIFNSPIEVTIGINNKIKVDTHSSNYIKKFNKQDLYFFFIW